MNDSPFWALISANLRLSNPQATNQFRQKGKNGKKLSRALWRQYLTQGIVFLFIYGFLMFTVDFSKFPGIFTHYVALFLLIAVSTGISAVYNVFFESQDLVAYLSLPFKMRDIFMSKIVVVAATIIPMMLPLLILFFLTGWQAGAWAPGAILLALVAFLFVLIVAMALCSLIVFGLARTAIFKKHKKLVTTGLLLFSMLIMVVGILSINNQTNNATSQLHDQAILSPFLPLFQVTVQPLSATGLGSSVLILAVGGLLVGLVRILIVPKLFEQLTQDQSATPSQQKLGSATKQVGSTDLRTVLQRYNRRLLLEPNLLLQIFTASLLMPIVFIISFGFTGTFSLAQADWQWAGVFFAAGLLLALLTVNQYSFIANLISLDQKNFNYIQALPLSLRRYLQQKFHLGYLIQASLNILVALLLKFVFKIPWLLAAVLILGSLLGTYLLCLRYFSRDYRLLNLDWTDLNQLFNRGWGRWGLLLLMSVGLLVGVGVLFAYSMAVLAWHSPWLDACVLAVILGLSAGMHQYYQRRFWRKLP